MNCSYKNSILRKTVKPGRYSGGEINSSVNENAYASIALCFPDVYEVGMSHLGLKILYERVNSDKRFSAERVFLPWRDFADELRINDEPLRSLETSKPLSSFDVLGFSVAYELSYTDILEVLALGKISLRRNERTKNSPIVIAGGHSSFQAAPIEPFLDGVFLGEGEEAILEIMECCLDTSDRDIRIEKISKINGMICFDVNNSGSRRIFSGFSKALEPLKPIVSNISTIHDRVSVEVMRGCTRGCRFCQAGFITRPSRIKSSDAINKIVMTALSNTGYEEVSLLALSTCDHPEIRRIINELYPVLYEKKVSLSIPSTRIDAFDIQIAAASVSGRRTGITLAPEVGSSRMDRIVNKGVSYDDLIRAAEEIFSGGWKKIKLYFLIGLPFEEERDIESMAELLNEVHKTSKRKGEIKASISIFCPKPWTPFQWFGMEHPDSLREKIKILRTKINRAVKLDVHSINVSLVESALSKADSKSADVLEYVWQEKGTHQSWNEFFNFDLWKKGFSGISEDLEEYSCRNFSDEDVLPWDRFSVGIEKSFLQRERERSRRAAKGEEILYTPDCFTKTCVNCGLACDLTQSNNDELQIQGDETILLSLRDSIEPKQALNELESAYNEKPILNELIQSNKSRCMTDTAKITLAFSFSKKGAFSYIGHLDLAAAFERALRRTGLPVVFSKGFTPRPQMRFAMPLPLGMEADAEYLEIDFYEIDSDESLKQINSELPSGLELKLINKLRYNSPMPKVIGSYYKVESQKISGNNLSEIFSKPFTKKKSGRIVIPGDDIEILQNEKQFYLKHKEGGISASEILQLILSEDADAVVTRLALKFL